MEVSIARLLLLFLRYRPAKEPLKCGVSVCLVRVLCFSVLAEARGGFVPSLVIISFPSRFCPLLSFPWGRTRPTLTTSYYLSPLVCSVCRAHVILMKDGDPHAWTYVPTIKTGRLSGLPALPVRTFVGMCWYRHSSPIGCCSGRAKGRRA